MKKFISAFYIGFVLGLLLLVNQGAQAKKLSLIRDAETEATLRVFIKPLLRAAGLEPDSINLHIVNHPTLNAYVAGGQNIFIHTGLLMASQSSSQIIGVLAHEIGHIAGGHLSRMSLAQKEASKDALLGSLLGGAAAVLLGNPAVGAALASGGLQVGTRNLLRFSRDQELAADRAALGYLDATKQSAKDMLVFMELLTDQELLSLSNQDPYTRTHPPSQQRIKFLRDHIAKSQYSNLSASGNFQTMYARLKAKITAFTQPIIDTLRQYPESDTSVYSKYARSIAYYRRPELKKALLLINNLISETPNDPYFHELKGQMLFENGRLRNALLAYEQAVRLLPEVALIRADLGRVQLASNDLSLLKLAVKNFQFSLDKEPRRAFIWRQLGIAYGKLNKMGKSSSALAEEALLRGRSSDAIRFAEKAKKILLYGSPDWIRAEDIIGTAKQRMRRR